MSRRADIQKLISLRERHLQKLKEQQAIYGLASPPHILIEIEETEAELAQLQTQLAALPAEAEASAVSPNPMATPPPAGSPVFNIGALGGGTTNIQSLTIQWNPAGAAPPGPTSLPLSYEPQTILIPAGSFVMGSDDGDPHEAPRHTLTLPDYRLGKYPVTNRQYAEFLKQHKSQAAPDHWSLRRPPAGKLDHPLVGVSWFEALAYCDWLRAETGRPYRLPGEAEWEKAASWAAGTQRCYPWGDAFRVDGGNGLTAGLNDTTPVGTYSPQGDSPFGCADMAGNVEEWVSSLWGDTPDQATFGYPYRPDDGREDLQAHEGFFRVHRGGSFRSPAERLRCASRGRAAPGSKIRWRGFRVALDAA